MKHHTFYTYWYGVLMLLGFSAFQAHAQQYRVLPFNKDNGLQNERVTSLAYDKLGFVWLGTDEGLAKYDGKRFHFFDQGLPSPLVRDLLYHRKGEQLLVLTDQGLVAVQEQQDSLRMRTVLEGSRTYRSNKIYFGKQLYEDRKGNVWVADLRQIFRLDIQGQVRQYSIPAQPQEGLPSTQPAAFLVAESEKGALYAFSRNGYVYALDKSGRAFQQVAAPDRPMEDVRHVLPLSGSDFLVSSAQKGVFVMRLGGGIAKLQPVGASIDATYAMRHADGTLWVSSEQSGLFQVYEKDGSYQMRRHGQLGNYAAQRLYSRGQDTWLVAERGLQLLQPQLFSPSHISFNPVYDVSYRQGVVSFIEDGTFYEGRQDPKGGFSITSRVAGKGLRVLEVTSEGSWVGDANGQLTLYQAGKVARQIDLSAVGKSIMSLTRDAQGNLWVCQDGVPGPIRITSAGQRKIYGAEQGISGRVNVLEATPSGMLYAGGSSNAAFLMRYNPAKDRFENLSKPVKLGQKGEMSVNGIVEGADRQNLYLATNFGVLSYRQGSFERLDLGDMSGLRVKSLAYDRPSHTLWFTNAKGLMRYHVKTEEVVFFDAEDGLPANTAEQGAVAADSLGNVWVGTPVALFGAPRLRLEYNTASPVVTRVDVGSKSLYQVAETGEVPVGSFLKVWFEIPEYPNSFLDVQMRILGHDEHWKTVQSEEQFLLISDLPQGSYTLQVRARKAGDYAWSYPVSYRFNIYKQWYTEWWAWGIYCILLGAVVAVVIRLNLIRTKREKRRLEEIISNRTKEVEVQAQQLSEKNHDLEQTLNRLKRSEAILNHNTRELEKNKQVAERAAQKLKEKNHVLEDTTRTVKEQNLELWETRDQIMRQSEVLREQSELLARQNENIMSSVNYARRIQRSVLGTAQDVQKRIASIGQGWDSFVYFKPRDVVSGDFYWFTEKSGQYVIIAADCTGHGIPGAFMSLIGNDMLHQVIQERGILHPGQILKLMDEMIQKALNQHAEDVHARDGMDISICVVNPRLNTLTFAGAGNPMYYIDKEAPQEMRVLKGEYHGIGGREMRAKRQYNAHTLPLERVKSFYLFSDGFKDQFGGEHNQRLLSRNFRQLLFDMHQNSMAQQAEGLELFLQSWTQEGLHKQIDDILVIGVHCEPFLQDGQQELELEGLQRRMVF